MPNHSDRFVKCTDCKLRKLPIFRPFTDGELVYVEDFKAQHTYVPAGRDIVLPGATDTQLFTLFSGWAFRYKIMSDGRRQILNFLLPGDFIGLQSSVFEAMDHGVETLSDVELCVFPRAKLFELFQNWPALAFDVTWLASHEESLVDEQLTSVGQRSALERVSYLLIHLFRRKELLRETRDKSCDFPLTQQHLADSLGLSLVHANRTIRKLVTRKLITLARRRLTIHDPDELARIADYRDTTPVVRPII